MRKLAILLALFCVAAFAQKGSFTDSRDGKAYKTVKIGIQTWMAENLSFNANGSKCYDNKQANCVQYGRMYDWATAMNLQGSCNSNSCSNQVQAYHQGICPSGWHIPSDDEWQKLVDFVGGMDIAGKKLKTKAGWKTDDRGRFSAGVDEFGFSALPGGSRAENEDFKYIGLEGNWWSATENKLGTSGAWHRAISYYSERIEISNPIKSHLFSVRCVQDYSKEYLAKETELKALQEAFIAETKAAAEAYSAEFKILKETLKGASKEEAKAVQEAYATKIKSVQEAYAAKTKLIQETYATKIKAAQEALEETAR
jgi:uncharacterized protein (TIGR02145 family)